MLEPSPQRARNCPPSGASWTVSGPVGPCPASSLGVLGWGSRNPGPGPGLLDPQPTQCLPAATTASRFYRIDPAQVSSPSPSATPSIPSTGGLTRPRPCPRIGRGPALQTGVHRARPRGQGPGCPGKACCRGGAGGAGGRASQHRCRPEGHRGKSTAGQGPGCLGESPSVGRGWQAGGPGPQRARWGESRGAREGKRADRVTRLAACQHSHP